MGREFRGIAAVVLCLGLAACVRTTEGSVAMTTEPGGPITTSSPTRTTTRSEVPASPGATTMKCSEFTELDQAERLAVVKEILTHEDSVFGPLGDDFAESMAHTMCQFMPDETVYQVLMGSPPP